MLQAHRTEHESRVDAWRAPTGPHRQCGMTARPVDDTQPGRRLLACSRWPPLVLPWQRPPTTRSRIVPIIAEL